MYAVFLFKKFTNTIYRAANENLKKLHSKKYEEA